MTVAVIIHSGNSSVLDKSIIREMFLGKKKSFSNGRTAMTLSPETSDPVMTEFNEKVIERTNSQVKAYWSKVIFTGKGTPPQELGSASEMISAVSSNPDAIGYVDAAAVTDAVKVVLTL